MRTCPPTRGRSVVVVGEHPVDLLRAATTARSPASTPPRRSTRRSSASAPVSSGMCSSTSDVMTASKQPSGNGRAVASPRSTPTTSLVLDLAGLGHRGERRPRRGPPRRRRGRGRRCGSRAGRARRRGGRTRRRRRARARPGAARARSSLSKRTVSSQAPPVAAAALATFWGIASTSRYCSTVSSAQRRHVQRSTTRRRPASPTRARSSGSSRPRRIVVGERVGVAGRALQHRLAVAAGDLGQGAAVGRHEGGASGHRLDRRQAEALVQARHDGQLRLGVELDDALVGDPGDERARSRRARGARSGPCSAPVFGRPMIVSETSRSVRSLATASMR